MNKMKQWQAKNSLGSIKKIAKVIWSPLYYFRIFVNDVKALLGITYYPTKVIFVAGYPKSGTTWVENFISNIPGFSPRVLGGDSEILRHHGIPSDAFKGVPRYAYSAIKTHAMPHKDNIDVLINNGVTKVLVMYRDPRDIIVSNYYHVLKNNPWKAEDPFYADYNKMSKEDAISHSAQVIIEDFCSWIKGWRQVPSQHREMQCLHVTYEQLRQNPILVFRRILAFFSIELDEASFQAVIKAATTPSASKPSGREPGTRSTRRNGMTGEWRKEMNDRQREFIKQHAGMCLVELGYESSLEW